MPATRKSARQAGTCGADPIPGTVITADTAPPAAGKKTTTKRAQPAKNVPNDAILPAEAIESHANAPAPVKQGQPRTTARGGKAATKGRTAAASGPACIDESQPSPTTSNETELASQQPKQTKPAPKPKGTQPDKNGPPVKAPRKPNRPAAVIQAEKEEKQRARGERERQKVVKATLAKRFEEYDKNDHEAVTNSQAAAIRNLQDTRPTHEVLEQHEDFSSQLAEISICMSDFEELGEGVLLPKTAANQGVSLKEIDDKIKSLKVTNGQSSGKGKVKSNPLPLASGLNPDFQANIDPRSAKLVFHEFGGLTDEDTDAVPPFEDDSANWPASPTKAGALVTKGKRAAPVVGIVNDSFYPQQPSVLSRPSAVFSPLPAQDHWYDCTLPLAHSFETPSAVFTVPANQAYQPTFAPPATQDHIYQPPPQQFPRMSTNPFTMQGQTMRAMTSTSRQVNIAAMSFQQPARQQFIKPILPSSRSHSQPVIIAPAQQNRLGTPRTLTAHTVRIEHLPPATQVNNQWKKSFLPTLTHALFISDEPFKGFVLQTPKMQANTQAIFDRVYNGSSYTVQLLGDPVHLMAYNRVSTQRARIGDEALKLVESHLKTFRTLTEAYNWISWAKTFTGPLFFQHPTPTHSPHLEVVSGPRSSLRWLRKH
ncbi:hypothetical protein FA15DRAFT_711136 [Coprinopsis marcescibilis]|uniref:Uncharacterized protein n=1 Tax=Coprinopsis marcescibilis TaxID=230819 RepID=A0A5C3KB05_COPMA|nr:hypothetical protein FA15DRAFT_711136 [Coprinopsis marcescibilis]